MSNISYVHDALVTRISAVLTSHFRLPNPYVIADNADIQLKLGFAVGFGPGANTNRVLGCNMSINRSFIVTITRQLFAKDQDYASRVTVEKNLFEDEKLIIQDLETTPTLGDSTHVTNARFISDDGIQAVFSDSNKFLMLPITIDVEYFENI